MENNIYDPLFQPLRVGSMTIPNRIVLCAVGGTALIDNGSFNPTPLEFFLRCAKGGAGLIIPGLSLLSDKWGRPGWLDEAQDAFRGPLKDFLSRFHEETESKLVMQLGAGMGRGLRANFGVTLPYFNYHQAMVAPTDGLPNVFAPEMKHRALSADEIKKLIHVMVNSAVLAKETGCDGVEIHAIHEGYLLDQFALSSLNHRTDQYGGCLENRLRISTEMIRGIKSACGEDFPVLMRYSAASKTAGLNQSVLPGQDYTEWGRSLEESISVVRILEDAGVDALDMDNGTYDSWHWCHPPAYMPEACNLPEAAYLKHFCHVPVFVSGKMGDPDTALKAVVSGSVDAVALARPFLADNDWAKKVRSGETNDIRPCIGCHNGCFGRLTTGKNVSCALNPIALQENHYQIIPVTTQRKVMVIGGGIAGMEAARLCALRGFDVSLYEQTDRLGGVFQAAAAPQFKADDKKLLLWYEKQLRDLNIPVHLNTKADRALILQQAPDIVLAAIGSAAAVPPIPGVGQPFVVSAKEYLLNNDIHDKSVVVIGGGLTGCEVAYNLALQKNSVFLVEMQTALMQSGSLCTVNTNMLKDLLSFHQVQIYTRSEVLEITDTGVTISRDGQALHLQADFVIIATGYRPIEIDFDLPGIEFHKLGDCAGVGNLLTAIWGAADTVINL